MFRKLVVLTALAVVILPAVPQALAAPLAPAKPSQTVTVLGNTAISPVCVPGAVGLNQIDKLQKGDGTTGPFVIPPKNVLVVTSLDFVFTTAPASRNVLVNLVVVDAAGASQSTATIAPALADSFGFGGGTVALPAGFSVKPDAHLCFGFFPVASGVVFVHGFLTKDK